MITPYSNSIRTTAYSVRDEDPANFIKSEDSSPALQYNTSARQGIIEPNKQDSCIPCKTSDYDQFDKVAARLSPQNLTDRSISPTPKQSIPIAQEYIRWEHYTLGGCFMSLLDKQRTYDYFEIARIISGSILMMDVIYSAALVETRNPSWKGIAKVAAMATPLLVFHYAYWFCKPSS